MVNQKPGLIPTGATKFCTLNDDPGVPFPTDTLTSRTLVADVVTNPKVTPWLADGLKKGCKIQYGAEMADGQFGIMGRHMGLEIPDADGF